MTALVAGFIASMSLIVAIGAQNAYLLRLGLSRSHITVAVVLCASADATLIAVGIGGLGHLIARLPWLLTASKWIGVAYLVAFGAKSLWSARRPGALIAATSTTQTRRAVVVATLGFTFLNPHVYLDTVLLLGSIGNQYGHNRWFFALGAAMASVTWFVSLGFGARLLSRAMAKPATWRVLDVAVGLIMVVVAFNIATLSTATL
jgi:L-lysine exporter family protein LysE/ArgO